MEANRVDEVLDVLALDLGAFVDYAEHCIETNKFASPTAIAIAKDYFELTEAQAIAVVDGSDIEIEIEALLS